MKNLNQIKPGESIWLYIWEPMEEHCPVIAKEYILTDRKLGGNGNWVRVKSIVTDKEEDRVINNFDYGVSAHSGNKIYIWLSEFNEKKSFEILKRYYMEKLVKATNDVSRLATIFDHMEGWIDIFGEEAIIYADDKPEQVIKNGSLVDLTEETEEVDD